MLSMNALETTGEMKDTGVVIFPDSSVQFCFSEFSLLFLLTCAKGPNDATSRFHISARLRDS